MTVYTVEDLQAEGIPPEVVKTRSQISCFSTTFIRERDLPKRFKDEALNIVKSHLDSGIQSFIVETALYVTVWKEEPQKPEVPIDDLPGMADNAGASPRNSSDVTPPPAAAPSPLEPTPAPRRTIVRKYRGQEYTIEI